MRRTVNILGQTHELTVHGPSERGQGTVAMVGLGTQGQVTTVGVEEPHEARVGAEGAHRGQPGGIVAAPETPGPAEGGQAGRGGEAGPTECEDPARGPEGRVEGLDVFLGEHWSGCVASPASNVPDVEGEAILGRRCSRRCADVRGSRGTAEMATRHQPLSGASFHSPAHRERLTGHWRSRRLLPCSSRIDRNYRYLKSMQKSAGLGLVNLIRLYLRRNCAGKGGCAGSV